MNGWGPKGSASPSKPGKSNLFGGISQDFAGISRRCLKSLRKIVVNFRPLYAGKLRADFPFSKLGLISMKATCYSFRSGRTDPVQFKGVFKQDPFCL